MNRTVFIVWLLVFFLALVAGWSVHAGGTHPVADNMCGAHSYGDCYKESDWITGWYDYLRHVKSELPENSRDAGWRNTSNGISYSGQPVVPEATQVSAPQTVNSSDQECHVQFVVVFGTTFQKCVPEEKFWCDKRNSYSAGSTAREYVEWSMPSHISC